MTYFESRVLEALKSIPRGKITTYKFLAEAVGCPGASRAVGNALNKNPDAPIVACHRVVKSSGRLGGYVAGSARKQALLQSEGIKIENGKIVNFNQIVLSF